MHPEPYRQITRHHCRLRHWSYLPFARCSWPDAAWVWGEGRWATVTNCRGVTVMLHATLDDALAAVDAIDRKACGGGCQRRHEVVELVIPAARVVARAPIAPPDAIPALVAGVR